VIARGDGGNPDASTAVASAIRTGQTRIVRNIGNDPAYAPWGGNMRDYGCCIANPLPIDGAVAGALAIYSANIDDFSADEATLLAECADDMAFGIAAIRTREQMHQLSYFDPLTRLPNEARFTHLAALAIDAVEPGEPGLAAVQIRLERLRDINEALGLQHGDDLLRQFGQRLQSVLPEAASVARLRGDEFAMLLPGSSVSDALLLARQMQALLTMPFLIAELPVKVTARMGITHFPQHAQTVHDLMRQMDIAVGRAREQKQQQAVYESSLDQGQGQAARLVMVGELRHAIDAGELALYLQPKVDMRNKRICGAEGLVRWRHPRRGLVPPADFIALAECTELIRPLTEWMIAAALRFNAGPLEPGAALPVAINLSASNLQDASLISTIHDMRVAMGLAQGLLEIELTESVLMEDAEHALQVLGALRAKNVTLYIDDFGTGYSSLSYLQKLPVDCIKIDQSFVARMLHDNDSAVIVRSTIDLAHDLGRKVVAEGVENQAQWDRLAAFGCDMAQGYFIAAPMPSEQFRTWAVNWDERRKPWS
jgi:diguanylate cyclase (GGDEF)-like protein